MQFFITTLGGDGGKGGKERDGKLDTTTPVLEPKLRLCSNALHCMVRRSGYDSCSYTWEFIAFVLLFSVKQYKLAGLYVWIIF